MSIHRILNRRVAAAIIALAAGQFGCVVHSHPREVVYVEATPPRPVVVAQPVLVEEGVSGDVVVEDFNEPLSNYGVWVYDARYGRVWQPAPDVAGAGFRPYASDGQWVVNEDGDYVFQSRYDAQWGWATYHYGRWVWNDAYGWVWLPGRAWAPSWVEWRYGGGYVGWAPMGPPGYVLVEEHYVFVEHAHFGSPTIFAHAVPAEHVHIAYSAAAPIIEVHGAAHWRAGPPQNELRNAGVVFTSAHVAAPGAGYVKSQGRLAIDGAADRRATGRVTTNPQVRPGVPVPNAGPDGARAQVGGGLQAQAQPQPGPGARPGMNQLPGSGPSRADSNPMPGPSRADSNPMPGPSRADSNPMPAPGAGPGPVTRPVAPAPLPVPAPAPARPISRPSAPAPAPAPAPPPVARPSKPAAPAPRPAAGGKKRR